MKQMLVISMLVEMKPGTPPEYTRNAFNQIEHLIDSGLRLFGIKLIASDTLPPRKPTKKESMALVPPAIHHGSDIWSDCTSKRSFPRSRIVTEWPKVTCQRCLAKKPVHADQKELFP